jgi:hypothetical protein
MSMVRRLHGGRLPLQQPSSRMILQQLRVTDIAAQGIDRLVAAHARAGTRRKIRPPNARGVEWP